MMKRNLLSCLAAAMVPLVSACVYDFDPELTEDQYAVVVEGDIVVGDWTTIRFARLNEDVLDVTDVSSYYPSPGVWYDSPRAGYTVRIEGDDGTVLEGSGVSGSYASYVPCVLDTRYLNRSARYRMVLHDDLHDQEYATPWMEVLGAPVIDSLSYKIADDKQKMDVRVTFHSDGSSPYYSLTYDEEWEYHSFAQSYLRYVPADGMPPSDGSRVFPDREGDWFPFGRIFYGHEVNPNFTCWDSSKRSLTSVVSTGRMAANKLVDYVVHSVEKTDLRVSVVYRPMLTVKIISQASYEYWENLDQVSGQTGDLFSPVPSSMRGNVVNVADPKATVFGYVGISTAETADLFISDRKTGFFRTPAYIDEYLWANSIGNKSVPNPNGGDPLPPHGVSEFEMPDAYANGYLPWQMETPEQGEEIYYTWIHARCLDCRTQGGSTERPAGWPEQL